MSSTSEDLISVNPMSTGESIGNRSTIPLDDAANEGSVGSNNNDQQILVDTFSLGTDVSSQEEADFETTYAGISRDGIYY